MKLELGAGARPAEGFVAVDVNPAMGPHVVADARNLPFATGSVDELRCVDVAEHVVYDRTRDLFREWARVLRPGGELFVQVPNCAEVMRWFVQEPDRLTTWVSRGQTLRCTPIWGAQWRILGGMADGRYVPEDGPYWWNAHFAMFSEESLRDVLEGAGFVVRSLVTNPHPNCQAVATRR